MGSTQIDMRAITWYSCKVKALENITTKEACVCVCVCVCVCLCVRACVHCTQTTLYSASQNQTVERKRERPPETTHINSNTKDTQNNRR